MIEDYARYLAPNPDGYFRFSLLKLYERNTVSSAETYAMFAERVLAGYIEEADYKNHYSIDHLVTATSFFAIAQREGINLVRR